MFTKVKYTGSVPGADANTYNILNSISGGWPGNWPAQYGVYKVVIDIHHDNAGTLKWYKTQDDLGVASPTWVQMGQLAVAAPAATAGTQLEVFVEAEKHVKIDWVNGGAAQTTFQVDISLSSQRAQI
jgi:hypothetical protein